LFTKEDEANLHRFNNKLLPTEIENGSEADKTTSFWWDKSKKKEEN
jgi:hypothetical protein